VAHDLLAELAGYTNELAGAERRGRDEHATAVRAEVARVRAEIATRAEILEAQSADHIDAGQDVKAAQAAIEARELRQALEVPDAPATAPLENAADSRPRRTAAAKKGA
jgi:hypothetical protein